MSDEDSSRPAKRLAIPESGIQIPGMGIRRETTIADALFPPVLQRVLGLLYGQPDREFLGSELIRLAGSGTGATHRVLKRLAASGIARVERRGRQLYYSANPQSPIHEELRSIVRKLLGVTEVIREALGGVSGIETAFVYGSVASGTSRPDSDIDLLVVGEVDYGTVYERLNVAEMALGRRIDPTVMTPGEWGSRMREEDSLARRIASGARLSVIGGPDD